jgi:hypothetical protein
MKESSGIHATPIEVLLIEDSPGDVRQWLFWNARGRLPMLLARI